MKNIRWILIIIFTLSAVNTFAQYADDNVTVNDSRKSKDPFKGKNKAQDLDSGKITKISLPDPDINPDEKTAIAINVSGIQIINEVGDSTILGYVQTGMFNKWKPAALANPFTEYLQSYVDQRYHSIYKKEGAQLVIVIQEVRIGERTFSMSERSFLHFKAISFAGDNSGKFTQIGALDTILTKGGMDVTHKHGENIIAALQILLARTPVQSPETYTLSELKEKAAARYNVPALQAKEHADGIYLTFKDFLADKPSVTDIEYENDNNIIRFYHKDSSGNKIYVDKFWGVRKSGALLKQYDYGALIPIEQKQNSIYLTNYLSMSRRNNNAIIWGAAGGGMLGAAIAGTIAAGTMPLVENVPYIKKKAPYATRVDIETGELAL
ncbi:hypothetical protein [Chitinophaga silvisoli]|uniref:Uncharacterized protein n=1 Tax=Chitinophaga silvisoli TaxID=2291814 RepID=A0A3E1NNH7_9BACT|nr:hypothetical protein [Chitinophaga silvisoli]RFM29348.1 hypothetical protein DXN04_33415 [Chitinophaga silvisoli]